jgi:antitoxin VapB
MYVRQYIRMNHASKVFISGNTQAIRIPKEFQVSDKELYIQKVGSALFLFPKSDPWKAFKESISEFSDDCFHDGRMQPDQQDREEI